MLLLISPAMGGASARFLGSLVSSAALHAIGAISDLQTRLICSQRTWQRVYAASGKTTWGSGFGLWLVRPQGMLTSPMGANGFWGTFSSGLLHGRRSLLPYEGAADIGSGMNCDFLQQTFIAWIQFGVSSHCLNIPDYPRSCSFKCPYSSTPMFL